MKKIVFNINEKLYEPFSWHVLRHILVYYGRQPSI
jgi:hypothetical protein